MITGIIASVESAEAVKILTGSPAVRKSLMYIDIWNNRTDYIDILKNPDCPVCVYGEYEFLGKMKDSYTTNLCGRESVQVIPGTQSSLDFEHLSERLKKIGTVKQSKFMLSFEDQKVAFNLFPDGRAIIKNVKDELVAKSVYAEYIGL
jgi:adenylyltransferase/sulfurtransferase